MPLTALAEGHRILALDQHFKPVFAPVASLLRSPAEEPYVEIKMHSTSFVSAAHTLLATLHHTFPTCGTTAAAAAAVGEKSTATAQDLKSGDCLHTAYGKALVASVKRVAPLPGAVTYSIQLAGGASVHTVAIGGVFTHAQRGMDHHLAGALSTRDKAPQPQAAFLFPKTNPFKAHRSEAAPHAPRKSKAHHT